jgi:uncharacterized metal-binding protein
VTLAAVVLFPVLSADLICLVDRYSTKVTNSFDNLGQVKTPNLALSKFVMSSGRTHDRITLLSLPILTGISLSFTRNAELTLWVAGSFLFGGLMFGPDLDIHSNQSIRWGWFGWLWQPYRRAIPHRSIFSHGPIIGTVCRLLYVAMWLALGGLISQSIYHFWGWPTWNELQIWRSIQKFVLQHFPTLLGIFVGLEIGAMSHYSADFLSSLAKSLSKKVFKPEQKSGVKKKPQRGRKTL